MGDFLKFKPVCVELLKAPTLDSLTKLRGLIEESEAEPLQQLQEYVLFPLFITASNTEIK